MSPTRRTARAAAAVVATVALGASGLVVLAPQAQAAEEAVVASSATWGFKQSFRTYLGYPANDNASGKSNGATITLAEGAKFTGNTVVGGSPRPGPLRNTSSYSWPTANGGTYDPVTRAGTIRLGGKLTYTLPKHCIEEISILNPTVVLAGNGTGVLKADVARNLPTVLPGLVCSTTSGDVGSATQVTLANLSNVPAPTVTTTAMGQTHSFAGIVTTLTADGVANLGVGDYGYPAGTVLDPINVSACFGGECGPAPTATQLSLSPTAVQYGRASTAKIVVTGGVPAGTTVTVKDGSRLVGSAKLTSTGAAYVKLPTNLAVRRHTIVASFAGTAAFKASSKSASLLVAKATTKASASLPKKSVKASKRAYLNAKITATGFVPSGIVRVKEGSKVLASARLVRGKATIKLPKLKRGKHKLAVVYAGNGVAKASASGKVTLTVKK